MAHSGRTPADDPSQLSFEDWIPYLKLHEDKSAIRSLLTRLETMPPYEKFDVYCDWKVIEVEAKKASDADRDDREERQVVVERKRSRPRYRRMLEDKEYIEIQEQFASACSKYESLNEKHGWRLIQGCLDRVPEEYLLFKNALAEFQRVRKRYYDAEQLFKQRYRVVDEPPVLLKGWTGAKPAFDVQTLSDMLRYLKRVLASDPDIETLNDAITNAYSLFEELAIPGTPPIPGQFEFPDPALAFIKRTIQWIEERLAEPNGLDMALQPAAIPTQTKIRQSQGWKSVAELHDSLGIHESRREAFKRRLNRARADTFEAYWWQEVKDRRRHGETFQYRVDAPELIELAEPYRRQKRK